MLHSSDLLGYTRLSCSTSDAAGCLSELRSSQRL
jgi:hypothetical protein